MANEGFVKSLVSFGDNQPRSSVSHMSNESLISSLIGGDSIMDEPHYMEQTSLMDIEHTSGNYQVRIYHHSAGSSGTVVSTLHSGGSDYCLK